jgi:poly-gamma-glutamate capsule biosynthesis protein CapA/YwtB (metallophosphatase superfamily)
LVKAPLTLFLCGDVMTGRGIDQILPHPSLPRIYESYCKSALDYVELAQQVSGRVKRPVSFEYIWGNILPELDRLGPDARIINLETAISDSEDPWPNKGIHYRMSPNNVPCLLPLKIDCLVLSNNHVLDWGRAGLEHTLDSLRGANVNTAGCGRNAEEAAAPAVIKTPRKPAPGNVATENDGFNTVLVFAYGMPTSGVPSDWAATNHRSGVNYLRDLSAATVQKISEHITQYKHMYCRDGHTSLTVVFSVHWGGNWGFEIEEDYQRFAHALIDDAGVDVVHGHSSHHVKGIEVYKNKPIIYGCGDFLNDYEGISGHEEFRSDLSLMYFPVIDTNSNDRDLVRFFVRPTKVHRLSVQLMEDGADYSYLVNLLNRESAKFGVSATKNDDGTIELRWPSRPIGKDD